MLYSADPHDRPDTAVTSLFGTTYIDFALATSIAVNRDIKPPYSAVGVRLPSGRCVWIVHLRYSDTDIAYFWDWRDAKRFMRQMNQPYTN